MATPSPSRNVSSPPPPAPTQQQQQQQQSTVPRVFSLLDPQQSQPLSHSHTHSRLTAEDRFASLLAQLANEFQALRYENLELRERVRLLEEGTGQTTKRTVTLPSESGDGLGPIEGTVNPKHLNRVSKKLEAAYRASTNKMSSVFRTEHSSFDSALMRSYLGHTDGIFDIHYSTSFKCFGTASADFTCRLWSPESGLCTHVYQGHKGAVNSIRFHPQHSMVCSASGDNTVHLWKVPASLRGEGEGTSKRDSLQFSDPQPSPLILAPPSLSSTNPSESSPSTPATIDHKPVAILNEHTNVVSCAAWMLDGVSLVSGSWDRTVKIWDVETQKVMLNLLGHDQGITHVAVHPNKKLIVSTSKDTTFRLWDFRQDAMHEVNVFQGHAESVNCALFASSDKVISTSDDRTFKIWDLRHMRAPLHTRSMNAAANRMALSPSENILAVPSDDRCTRLFDLSANRLARLPKHGHKGHIKSVASVCWAEDGQLFTAGYDGRVAEWRLRARRAGARGRKQSDGGSAGPRQVAPAPLNESVLSSAPDKS